MADSHFIPLFPLGTVLLPGTALPLHIFEERYRLMIADCEKHKRDFGIVYYNGANLKRAGCTARVLGVVHNYDDGRMDILTSGMRRFEILSIEDTGPYLKAEVRYFDDKEDDVLILNDLANRLVDTLEGLAEVAGKRFDSTATRRLSAQALSFVLANTDLSNLDERQHALEIRSTRKRLEKLLESAGRAFERARSTRKLQKVLGFKGDISHLFN